VTTYARERLLKIKEYSVEIWVGTMGFFDLKVKDSLESISAFTEAILIGRQDIVWFKKPEESFIEDFLKKLP